MHRTTGEVPPRIGNKGGSRSAATGGRRQVRRRHGWATAGEAAPRVGDGRCGSAAGGRRQASAASGGQQGREQSKAPGERRGPRWGGRSPQAFVAGLTSGWSLKNCLL